MNFIGEPDLGRHALKETDQFPCELQVIPLAFSFPIYHSNSFFTSSSAQDSTFSKLSMYSSVYSLFDMCSTQVSSVFLLFSPKTYFLPPSSQLPG